MQHAIPQTRYAFYPHRASVLHIPIEHADDVNKLFVIPRVVNVSLAILSLLSASITQQYTMKRLPCVL